MWFYNTWPEDSITGKKDGKEGGEAEFASSPKDEQSVFPATKNGGQYFAASLIFLA